MGDYGLIGQSPKIAEVRRLIEKVARTTLPVLLLGESGTGKEVVARAIHSAHPRGNCVPIDCGSLAGTLMESELFGHVKGAFSGGGANEKGVGGGGPRGGGAAMEEGGPPDCRRNASGFEGGSGGRALPAGPLLSPERAADPA